jgi:hypothetical protein
VEGEAVLDLAGAAAGRRLAAALPVEIRISLAAAALPLERPATWVSRQPGSWAARRE